MKSSLKLLTNNCCEDLLKFQSDSKVKQRYSLEYYPKTELEEVTFSTQYFIDDDLELSTSPKDDVNSSILIFNELKDLDRVQANGRRLWVSLTHGRFFNYTKERWSYNENYSNKALVRRFHFEGTSLEARMRNSISRLWWAAKLTYDETRTDPFELTRLLWSKQDLIQNIVERTYGTYECVLKGILETYQDNLHLSESDLRVLYTGLNSVGGVKILPFMSITEIKEVLANIAKFNNIQLN